MKRKGLIIGGIVLGVLALLFILAVPAAPLWIKLGVQPVCIQGDFPNIKVVPCAQKTSITPLPLPTLSGEGPIPIIFDDDGSPDGMLALLFFLSNPNFEVRAVTISVGEAHPEMFADHTARFLAGLGRTDIPVGYGRPDPLEGTNAFPDPWREASDLFWDLPLPEAADPTTPVPATALIVETVAKSDQPVVVFLSGTHTNLAEALRLEPGIAGQISDVHVMGGSIYRPGNIEISWPEIHNQTAEWNIWVDPLAAKEVFASGIPLHVSPLDSTDQIVWTRADARAWDALGTPESAWAADILTQTLDRWSAKGVQVWDLVTAINASDARLCPEVPLRLDVLTAPGPEQGRTVVVDGPANAVVCLEPDVEQIKARAAEILGP